MVDSHTQSEAQPAGYLALIDRFQLDVMPNWHQSHVSTGGIRRVERHGGVTEELYPSPYWPGEGLSDHLEFALKYDGTNLAILASIFQVAPVDEFTRYLESKPTGKYARRLWYLYERLTGSHLPLADLRGVGYVDLLEPGDYVTISPGRNVSRQRVRDNLLGVAEFCPIVRRTDAIRHFLDQDLTARCRRVVAAYPPDLLHRALSYLYSKETKSSFEIEHIKPNSTRTERFIALLQLAETEDFCTKPRLIDLQSRTVDPRYSNEDYRTFQNYVGETLPDMRERIHFVCPKPGDLPGMMAGLIAAHERMATGEVPAVVHAAAVAYGFVFLHPFEDGNGRIHRFLIHNILGRRGFTPAGIMVPVSAAMLKGPAAYNASLEAFSRPLLPVVEYELDELGQMTVTNDTARWYRYIDMTAQVEALYTFVARAIETELVEELDFLSKYDETKRAIQEIVDMPDARIDLFIRFCLQQSGRLSANKRKSHFDMLTDDEIQRMEAVLLSAYRGDGTDGDDVGLAPN